MANAKNKKHPLKVFILTDEKKVSSRDIFEIFTNRRKDLYHVSLTLFL